MLAAAPPSDLPVARLRVAGLALAATFLLGPAAFAQAVPTPADISQDERDFEGRSSTTLGSGARAYGMGGAFLARADDATAASWNPAGLSYLRTPELSVVFARLQQDREGVSVGRDSVTGYAPDFAAMAWPIRLGDATGSVQLSFQRVFAYAGERIIDRGSTVLLTEGSGGFDVMAVGTGVRVTRSLRIGATLNHWFNGYHLSRTRLFTRPALNEVDFGISGWNANFGLIWSPIESLNLGAVVKTPFTASVDLSRERTDGLSRADTLTVNSASSSVVELNFPRAYGVGASYRPQSNLTFALDYTRTSWSKSTIDRYFTLGATPPGAEPTPPTVFESLPYPTLDDPAQNDTAQLRFGVEYVILGETLKIPVRAGYFTDRQYYRSADGTPPTFHGFTAGIGLITGDFLFDVAVLHERGDYTELVEGLATPETVNARFIRIFASVIYRGF